MHSREFKFSTNLVEIKRIELLIFLVVSDLVIMLQRKSDSLILPII